MDTGTSLIYVPASIWDTFSSVFLKEMPDVILQSNGFLIGPCDTSKYKSVFIFVNGSYFEMRPEIYVLLDYNTGVPNICILSFIQNGGEYWLLGDGFIRNYYSIFDEDNSRIGFAPAITSNATTELNGTPPTAVLTSTPAGPSILDTYHFLPL